MSKLVVLLSLDWEGESLSRIKELNYFRKEIGEEIPLTHFIVPSYFIQFQENAEQARALVSELDEVALHLHPLRKLVEYFGITFRKEGNFYRSGKTDQFFRRIFPEQLHRLLGIEISGRGVPITEYAREELELLINKSRQLLSGVFPEKEIRGFRAGGNIVDMELLDLLHELGFLYDASAFPPEVLSVGYKGAEEPGSKKDLLGDYNGLYTAYVLKLWGEELVGNGAPVNSFSQPFMIGRITEFPMNGAMADFVTLDYLRSTTSSLLEKVQKGDEDQVLSLGLHLEGDLRYEAMIAAFIQEIKEKYHESVLFSTASQQIRYI